MFTKAFAVLKKEIPSGRPEEPLNKLMIEVDYSKGGWSCLTGERSNSGVYVFITPCRHDAGITSTYINGDTHTMGYKIMLKELSRRSQKQIDAAAALIIPAAQEIADLYSERKHNEVYNKVKSLYNI